MWDFILQAGGLLLILYLLVFQIDWDAVERWAWERTKHTALSDKDFEKLQKKLDEPPDKK